MSAVSEMWPMEFCVIISCNPMHQVKITHRQVVSEDIEIIFPGFDNQLSKFCTARNVHIVEIFMEKSKKLVEFRAFYDVDGLIKKSLR